MDNKQKPLKEEPPFSELEKKLFMNAYEESQEYINTSFYDPKKSFAVITEKLGLKNERIKITKENNLKKISNYLSSNLRLSVGLQASSVAASVFVFGVIFGMYAGGNPTNLSSSSSRDVLRSGKSIEKAENITISKDDPVDFINLMVNSGLDSEIKILISKKDTYYQLVLSDLRANDIRQAGIKAILNIPTAQQGEIVIDITKRNK